MSESPSTPAARAAIEQARQADGKFGEQQRAEDDTVDLLAVAPRPIPEGSFLYPPILRNAEDTIGFWEHVSIGDEVLHKVASTYVAQWAEEVDTGPEALWEGATGQRWEADHPAPESAEEMAAWEDERDRARAEFVNGLRETLRNRPEYLDPRDVRQCARVIGMVSTLRHLPVEEADKVREHEIELTTGMMSVRDANRNLGLSGMTYVVTDPAIYEGDPAADERLAVKVLTALRPFLEEQFEEHGEKIQENLEAINQNLGTTGEAIIDIIR